ncbi:MAG: ABC transporter permease [Acidobacteriota bacterium]
MMDLVKEIRYGLRVLLRKPGFTAIAVLTLALGIGANTAIFSLLDQVLLRRLPVPRPEELVVLRSPGPMRGWVSTDSDSATSFSHRMYKTLRERNEVFSGLLARYAIPLSVSAGGQTERAEGELVSGNYFEVLGVDAALGRVFSWSDDEKEGVHPVAVLSHGYWTRRFGANPSVLNQSILVNGHQLTVVGVAHAGFNGVQLGQSPDVFIPVAMTTQMVPTRTGLENWNEYWLALMGRLKPGLTPEQGEVGLLPTYHAGLLEQVSVLRNPTEDFKQRFLAKRIELTPGASGRRVLQRNIGTSIVALFGMVLGVLLIACTNVANLQLVRGLGRRREMAIRLALGSSRWQLARHLLTESLLLALMGGIVGLLVASWVSDLLVSAMSSGQSASGLSGGLDARVLAFGFGLSLFSGILCGLLPARGMTGGDMLTALKDQSVGSLASTSQARLRRSLVVLQVALTMLLLVGAGLMARTLWNLRGVDLGINADHLITFSIAPELNGYKPEKTIALTDQLSDALNGVIGVVGVGVAEVPLLTDNSNASNATFEGATSGPGIDSQVLRNPIGPGFLATLGIPLVSGRDFTRNDTATSQKVALINEATAKQFFAGRNPVGTRFGYGAGDVKFDTEIIGVVKDNRQVTVRQETRPFVYEPYSQRAGLGAVTFYVRTSQDPAGIGPALRRTVAALDPNLPVFDLKTMEQVVGENLFGERLMAILSICFGVLAALLAAIGLYGVLAYWVVQRTQEIGIRVALGASGRDIRALVLGQGMRLTAVGIVLGIIGAVSLSRLVSSMLFGISAMDPITIAGVAILFLLVALLACYIPARRATRVDPLIALRYQ